MLSHGAGGERDTNSPQVLHAPPWFCAPPPGSVHPFPPVLCTPLGFVRPQISRTSKSTVLLAFTWQMDATRLPFRWHPGICLACHVYALHASCTRLASSALAHAQHMPNICKAYACMAYASHMPSIRYAIELGLAWQMPTMYPS